MDYGLVLAGGGMRGAYQIGVWKALSEMKINVTAIAGTSIGAINGAMFAQGDYRRAEEMWRGIHGNDIISPVFSGDILKDGIADMSPLENMLRQVINEKKLRKSRIDFGIATFSLRDREGVRKFKAEIPQGKIVDYLMASACIPGVKAREIDGDRFIDGGVSNNMPVNMLTGRGMKNIISVDIKGIGMCEAADTDGLNVIGIVYKKPDTGIAEVDADGIDKGIQSGYIDALRAFGRVEGSIYSIDCDDYRRARGMYSQELVLSVEKAADIFGVNKYRIYTFDTLVQATVSAYNQYERNMALAESTVEKLRRMDGDKAVVAYLIKNQDIRIPLLPDCTRAASAVKYFLNLI